MGKKGRWFSAVRRVFSSNPEQKQAKAEKAKSKKKWRFGKSKRSDLAPSNTAQETAAAPPPPPRPPPPQPNQPVAGEIKDAKLADTDSEQNKHAYSVALASAVAAEAAAVAAQAAAEVVRLTSATPGAPRASMRSKEEAAAIKIQTAFRGYLARRALRALRGLVRLKSLVDGNSVRRQTTNALYCTQTMTRVQTQIHSRRIRMEEEKRALQRQLQLKQEQELEKLKLGEDWDHRHQSKEQIEASLIMKQEAAIRRERAMAYAFSHQWRNSSSRVVTPMFTDPNNPQWGWTWLERWMAARPWESRAAPDKDPKDRAVLKIASSTIRPYTPLAQTPSAANKSSRPPSRQSPSTPPSKAPSVQGKIRPPSPKGSWVPKEDDLRSIMSLRSERPRRQSLGGASVGDDASLTSTPAIPSYMQSTESARAKSRYRRLLHDKLEVAERRPLSASSAKKRLSFPVADKPSVPSPEKPEKPKERVRRHSDPPKMDVASLKGVPPVP